jgi:hypothetical protein
VCQKGVDDSACCDLKAKCSEFVPETIPAANPEASMCKDGFLLKVLAPNINCAQAKCDADTDHETCCGKRGMCSTYRCPDWYTHKHNADNLLCEDEDCRQEQDNYDTCCAVQGNCQTLQCPDGYIHRHNYKSLFCKGFNCDPGVDKDVCCVQVASCHTYDCPNGFG